MNCKALLNIAIEIALYKYCIIIIIINIRRAYEPINGIAHYRVSVAQC